MLSDPAAERGVLAGIFSYGGDAYIDVADILSSSSFTIDSNQIIWSCFDYILKDNTKGKVDFASILSASIALGMPTFFDKKEEKDHLRAIVNLGTGIDSANIRRFAARIRKLQIAREGHTALGVGQGNLLEVTGDESIDQIISLVEGPVFDFTSKITNVNNTGPVLMGQGAAEYFQYLMDNPRQLMGISTGMPRYDKSIGGGLRPNGMDLIGARFKTGKTTLVDNTSLHIAGKIKIPVLNVDTEMTREEHQVRVGGCLAGIPTTRIETGQIAEEEKKNLIGAANDLMAMPYYYDCVIGMQFEEILARMRRWVVRTVGIADNGRAKPCVIIYDYLKMMSMAQISASLKEYQILSFTASAIKNFMGRYGVACLCFAQLNREGAEQEDSRVLRGSDQILDSVTSFSIYKWKSEEEKLDSTQETRKYTHKLIPMVSRFGAGVRDGDYINIQTDYAKAKIIEGPLKSELEAGPTTGTNNAAQIIL